MCHRDGQSELVGQSLKPYLPGPHTVAIGSAAVRLDQQSCCGGITPPPLAQPPSAQGRGGEFRRFVGRSNHHVTCVSPLLVNPEGYRTAQGVTRKVVIENLPRFLSPASTWILEITDRLLLLGIDADYRKTLPGESPPLTFHEAELVIPFGFVFPRQPLAICSQRIAKRAQQPPHGGMTQADAAPSQFVSDVSSRLVHPTQSRNRVASGCVFDYFFQNLQHSRMFFSACLRPAPGRRTRPRSSGAAFWISSQPRRIVVRLRPVILANFTTPPCPFWPASNPTNKRRPLSSRLARTRFMARCSRATSPRREWRQSAQRHARTPPRNWSAMTAHPSSMNKLGEPL